MKQWLSEFRPALFATLALALVCCGGYPLVVYGFGRLLFRARAEGSLIVDATGTVRGSRLVGQAFSGARYFHSRPSAAGDGYDASRSGGSNLGPTSRKLRDSIEERLAAYRRENGLNESDSIPADAVTASGSGLDPHISPESARLQIARVAAARGWEHARVAARVEGATEPPQLGVLGQARVNVLLLNMALDATDSAR